jgi:multidrug efflux system outer membrane protein
MRKAAVVSLLAFLLGGCMVGPDYFRPAVETPPAWRVTDQDAKDLANTAWWEQFNDPVLNELVTTALRENKDLKIASARIDEFLGRYGVTRSQLFPQLGAGYEVSKQKNTLPGSTEKGIYNTYGAALGSSWEIDLWGKIRRQSEAAQALVLGSEEGKQGVILTLVSSVAGSYLELRSQDRQLEITNSTATSRGASYKIFQDRYAGGVISKLELSQNRSQYEEALASVPAFEKTIAQQENALSVLLGRNPGPILRGRTISDLSLPAIPEGLPSSLLERRPDIREAEQQLIAANAQIGAAKAAYFPTISLTGIAGVASGGLSNLFSGSSRVWQYGAAVNLPIFTAGGLAGQLQVAEAQQQQALFAYQKAIQNAFREVNDALIDQEKTRVQLAAQRRQVASLQEYADTALLRYDNGYTSYIEVLDAQRSLFNAELAYTQTQQALLQAMVNLYKAMGGGWMTEAEKLAVPPAAMPVAEAPAAEVPIEPRADSPDIKTSEAGAS